MEASGEVEEEEVAEEGRMISRRLGRKVSRREMMWKDRLQEELARGDGG